MEYIKNVCSFEQCCTAKGLMTSPPFQARRPPDPVTQSRAYAPWVKLGHLTLLGIANDDVWILELAYGVITNIRHKMAWYFHPSRLRTTTIGVTSCQVWTHSGLWAFASNTGLKNGLHLSSSGVRLDYRLEAAKRLQAPKRDLHPWHLLMTFRRSRQAGGKLAAGFGQVAS